MRTPARVSRRSRSLLRIGDLRQEGPLPLRLVRTSRARGRGPRRIPRVRVPLRPQLPEAGRRPPAAYQTSGDLRREWPSNPLRCAPGWLRGVRVSRLRPSVLLRRCRTQMRPRVPAIVLVLLMLGIPTLARAQSEREQYTAVSTWTFDREPSGGLPRGWEGRGGVAGSVYSIERERDGNAYLKASSHDDGVQLGVEVQADARNGLTLSWRWRVWELPAGGDERRVETMDSAAAVYAVFGSRVLPRVIKYVWSTTVPAGTVLRHPRSGRMAIVVITSGTEPLGDWRAVRRDLTEDYRRLFGGEPGRLRAVGVKSDSDSTSGAARADFDEFQLLHSQAREPSGRGVQRQ